MADLTFDAKLSDERRMIYTGDVTALAIGKGSYVFDKVRPGERNNFGIDDQGRSWVLRDMQGNSIGYEQICFDTGELYRFINEQIIPDGFRTNEEGLGLFSASGLLYPLERELTGNAVRLGTMGEKLSIFCSTVLFPSKGNCRPFICSPGLEGKHLSHSCDGISITEGFKAFAVEAFFDIRDLIRIEGYSKHNEKVRVLFDVKRKVYGDAGDIFVQYWNNADKKVRITLKTRALEEADWVYDSFFETLSELMSCDDFNAALDAISAESLRAGEYFRSGYGISREGYEKMKNERAVQLYDPIIQRIADRAGQDEDLTKLVNLL